MNRYTAKEIVNMISEIDVFAYYEYIPPYQVLKSLFSTSLKKLGLDECVTWRAFELHEDIYEEIVSVIEKSSFRMKKNLPGVPTYIDDVFKWQAWLHYSLYSIPYKEHLKYILLEKAALKKLNKALDEKNESRIEELHFLYLDAAQTLLDFQNENRTKNEG